MAGTERKTSIYPWKWDLLTGTEASCLHRHEFYTDSFQDCCLLHGVTLYNVGCTVENVQKPKINITVGKLISGY